jgi:hypothetical protein
VTAVLTAISFSSPALALPAPEANVDVGDPPPNHCGKSITLLDGDGDPHQNYYHMQVTNNLACGDGTCSMSKINTHTVGYSVNGGISQWISGGFSVEESFTTGESELCSGEAGETLCIWVSIAHTAYTAYDRDSTPGPDCLERGPSRVIKSPNADMVGSKYYCVRNACRAETQGYWNNDYAPTGGPGPSDA